MTYTVDLDYKTERIDYVFTYNAKEQREFDMADNVVAFTVSYRTFSHLIAPLKITKDFLQRICLRLLQNHLDGVACMLQTFMQLIADIPNAMSEEEDKVFQECEKRFNGWRYNIYE
jgi:hypothetical protein